MNKNFGYILLLMMTAVFLYPDQSVSAQGIGKVEKWLAVGSLQNWYSSIGCEREEDGPIKAQQAGWRWPSPYLNQDMQAAIGLWIGAKNYTEPGGQKYDFKVVHCGPRPQTGGLVEFFPMQFDLIGKFDLPEILVDGEKTYADFEVTLDNVDAEQPYDQALFNVVNTQMGVTMKRKIFQTSYEYYDNIIVIEYTFINTGNVDQDDEIERTSGDLEDAYFYFQYRMAPCKETRILFGDPTAWGRNTLNDERGPYRNDSDNPDNFRFSYAWHGYYQDFSTWNNVGGPILETDAGKFGARIDDADTVGRLGSAQFPGVLTLHADKSVTDRSDDAEQPRTTGYIASNHELDYASSAFDPTQMASRYALMTKGHPEKSHAELITNGDFTGSKENPGKGSVDDAGYSFVNGYGPYNIPYGDSVKIVMVQASAGLSRDEAIRIGKMYKSGEINDVAKNEYVMQGKDSLYQTFKRATHVYENDWQFPELPRPPRSFEIYSRGGRIDLYWDVYSDGPVINGFEIYRSTTEHVDGYSDNKYYSKYELIAELPADSRSFIDTLLSPNTAYYYYILSVGDNVQGNTELNIPAHTLKSSRFYTQTYAPAYKKTKGQPTISDKVRVVPNPYISSARGSLLYPGEENKIVFVNISGECSIRIYSEIGELIQTIEHNDGSGSQDWFLTTSSNQIVVSGIYIAVIIDNITGDKEIVKFTILR